MTPKQELMEVEGQESETKEIKEVAFEDLTGLLLTLSKVNPVEAPVRYAIMGETGEVISTLPAERYKAIIEKDDQNKIYGIVSKRYVLINHATLMERVVPHLHAIGLHHKETYLVNGKMFSKWMFSEEEVSVGDICGFGLLIRNSIDGSMALGIDFYVHRLICQNGAVMSLGLPPNANLRHLGTRLDEIEQAITEAVESFPHLFDLIKIATTTDIPMTQAKELLDQMNLPKYIKDNAQLQDTGVVSAWKLYNDLTYAITRSKATTATKYQYWNSAETVLKTLPR